MPYIRSITNKYITSTTAPSDIYLNGTSGDDTNDGSSVSTPVKSLVQLADILPTLTSYNTILHLAGTIDLTDSEYSSDTDITVSLGAVQLQENPRDVFLVVDGGTGTTVVDDNSGSNYTIDSDKNLAHRIGDGTAAWSTNEHRGLWVEILTGSAAGETRTIASNTSNTITPSVSWTVAPGAGSTFRIVRPTTTISANGTNIDLSFLADGGYIIFQNIYFTGNGLSVAFLTGSKAYVKLVGCVFNNTKTFSSLDGVVDFAVDGEFGDTQLNSSYAEDADLKCSVSSTSGKIYIHRGTDKFVMNSAVLKDVEIVNRDIESFWYNSIIGECKFINCRDSGANDTYPTIYGTTTQPNIFYNASGNGLTLQQSQVSIGGTGIVINGCSSHGIEVDNSRLDFTTTVSGTNTGLGVYGHSLSLITITDGDAPTLTGTVGDFGSRDAALEDGTWSDVDTAIRVSIGETGTIFKEV